MPLLKSLKTHKSMDLQVMLSLIVGCLALVCALINSARQKPGTSIFDRFVLQPMGGIAMILIMAMAIRWYLEPLVKMMSASLEPAIGFKVYKVLNLNYVVERSRYRGRKRTQNRVYSCNCSIPGIYKQRSLP
ncbi:MAG: hypothetical protein K9K63_11255 [Desulfotignum sp.]|nr:hypothetical protein [Desulfotignum sp.]MCF8088624.1 hypothetical protein [Desulfotignum sp.]MCF8137876.1 hypothetical protein [Desulfotignum sp.]